MSTLVVICGLSFAGKSTLARAIAETLGFQEVDVDEVGVALYGDPSTNDWNFDRVYDNADEQIERLLAAGVNVVDGSRNFTRRERVRASALTRRSNARIVTVFVDTPEAIVRQRRSDNRTTGARGDIADAQFEEIVQAFQPPESDENPLVFGVSDDAQSWIAKNAAAMVG